MNVTANVTNRNYSVSPQAAPTKEKSKSDNLVDQIVDKTYLSANYTASTLAGAASGTAAWVTDGIPQTLKSTGSAVKNILTTEKFGPLLKLVAATGAVAGGVAGGLIAAPVSFFIGAYQGADEVNNSVPRQFTVTEASKEGYTEVKGGLNEFAKGIQEEMKELGDYKLKPGEKRIEIPLIRAAKTIVMGSVAAVVGGAVGIATAAASMVTEAGKGIAEAFSDDRLNVAEKVFSSASSVVGAAAHGVSYGVRSGFSTFGQGIGTTWDKDSAIEGGKKLFAEAGNSLAISVAPHKVLLEEKPAEA